MYGDDQDLKPFRSHTGSTTIEGQTKAGEWEAINRPEPAKQQTYESHDAYNQRTNTFAESKSKK